MKCSACHENRCEREYRKRYMCLGDKESIVCTCTCQVSEDETFGTAVLSIGTGIAAAAGGVALTVMTGGLFAIIGGAALVGAGSSMVMNPIQKKITGECMTMKDTAQDILLGGTIGAITGPIGAGASTAAKGASGLVKFGIRVGAGAAAGAVSGTVSEGARLIKGEEVSAESFVKAVGIGMIAGSVGGASTHAGSNISKGVESGIGKAVTRIGVQATTAAVTDAGLQLADKGEIDPKQLILNTAGQITVATTAEVTHGLSKNTNAYTQKVNSEMIADNLDKDGNKISQAQLEAAVKEANSLNPKVVEKNSMEVKKYNEVQSKLDRAMNHKENLLRISDAPVTPQEKQALKANYCAKNKLPTRNTVKNLNRNIENLNKQASAFRPEKMGPNNVHFLRGDREGQVAIDLSPRDLETGQRSGDRVILQRQDGRFIYADHTTTHDYENCRKNISNLIPDSYDGLRPEHINLDPHVHDGDDDDENKSKKD